MATWVAWIWAVSVGLIRPFGDPGPSKLGMLTIGATAWLASPWGRATVLFALRPSASILGTAFAAGAARAGPAYAAAFAEYFPSTVARGSAVAKWARSPAGKGFGAGGAIGTLLIYPTLAKEGYITGYTGGFTQEQQMKEIVSKPGLPPGLGTRPIIMGGGGGGILV